MRRTDTKLCVQLVPEFHGFGFSRVFGFLYINIFISCVGLAHNSPTLNFFLCTCTKSHDQDYTISLVKVTLYTIENLYVRVDL